MHNVVIPYQKKYTITFASKMRNVDIAYKKTHNVDIANVAIANKPEILAYQQIFPTT